MSQLFDLSGNDEFYHGGPIYRNPKEATLFFPIRHNLDLYYPACKRSRVSEPYVLGVDSFEQEETTIEVLHDECLFEIFRRLDGDEERSACAGVSKRWLTLLSNVKRGDLLSNKIARQSECDGSLSRSLEGKKATDVRLASISVGTASRGGLRKLLIRGTNSSRGVSNVGLRAISHGCPSLKVLSLWNVPAVGDEGFIEIANGCHLLEKLDLSRCPMISDKALVAIAKCCPKLTDLTVESCPNIGNECLRAIGQHCPNLKSVSVINCPLVGDQGIAGLLSTSLSLKKLKLQALNIGDVALSVIGHYGKALTDLVFSGLQNVNERGFWVMGNGNGLQKLRSLTVTACQGATDLGLEAVGKGCPNLKHIDLQKCALLSDNGLVAFARAVQSLESVKFEECHGITQIGIFGLLLNCGAKLRALYLVCCFGIRDYGLCLPEINVCKSMRSLTVRSCPGFGNASLALLGKLCPQLENVEFSGLEGVTDAGFLSVLDNCEAGLARVNLSGCVNLTDEVVSSIAKVHGLTLEALNLEGCRKISDASLSVIADNCMLLSDLDVSNCTITDFGLAALAKANCLYLQIFSVSGCSLISDKSLPFLQKLGQSLLGLNIQHCNGISSLAIDILVEHLWKCDILS